VRLKATNAILSVMECDPQQKAETKKRLAQIQEMYGFIPVANKVLSERPDLFLPNTDVSRSVLEGKGVLDRKTRYLIATAAAAAMGGEYCIHNQMKHAIEAGANRDEILEALQIASFMAMTRTQSYAFREFAHQFNVDTGERQ